MATASTVVQGVGKLILNSPSNAKVPQHRNGRANTLVHKDSLGAGEIVSDKCPVAAVTGISSCHDHIWLQRDVTGHFVTVIIDLVTNFPDERPKISNNCLTAKGKLTLIYKIQSSGKYTVSYFEILILGKIEGRRKRGQQRMRWLDGITDLMDVSLNKF